LRLKRISVVSDSSVLFEWENSESFEISNTDLRKFCPCAECEEERGKQSSTYISLYTKDQLSIKNIRAIGNYGISIEWGDSHSTGIYQYEYLYRLGKKK